MKRLVTTLVIFLVVLIAGVAALVLLVNPNDFRAYMVEQVEQSSGYHLTLEGDLRWHAWPQLSILAGRMTVTAPGAQTPVISADNMRIDVELLPLLSHHLNVKQVMLKNAVIRLLPDSEKKKQPNEPIAPRGGNPVDDNGDPLWKFKIDKFQVIDSLLVWQRADKEQINVRDINLTLQQNDQRQAHLTLSSRVNRDQRDLAFALEADLDLQQLPHEVGAKVTRFSYHLDGADIPPRGIKGEGSLQAVYQLFSKHFTFNKLKLTANSSELTGDGSAQFRALPAYTLNLQATQLNLDELLGWQPKGSDKSNYSQPVTSAPVIANRAENQSQNLQLLRYFNALLNLNVEQVIFRGMKINQLNLKAENQHGLMTLRNLSGKLAGGHFALPGLLDVRTNVPLIKVQPILHQIELGDVFKSFDIPVVLTGGLNMQGEFSGESLTSSSFAKSWQGTADLSMQNAYLQGVNIKQIIHRVIMRNNNKVLEQSDYPAYTVISQIKAKAYLNKGMITLNSLEAESPLLSLEGGGSLDMIGKQCDIKLNVLASGGWQGNREFISQLVKTPIPLRIYGPWEQLNYQLQVDQLLRKALQDRAKELLSKWGKITEEQNIKKQLDKL